MIKRNIVIVVLLLSLLSALTHCTVSVFKREHFRPGTFSLQRHALVTSKESRAGYLLGGGEEPRVKFDLSIDSVTKEEGASETHALQIALFHSDDIPEIGRITPKQDSHGRSGVRICENGKLALSSVADRMMYDQVTVKSNERSYPFHKVYDITKSGVYYLLIANCDQHNDEYFRVSGIVEFKNPYGQLDAEQYGFLPFYGVSCLVYVLVGTIWSVWHLTYIFAKKSEENSATNYGESGVILPIQNWMTILFTISLFESILWYIHYFEWNNSLRSSTSSRNMLYSLALIVTLLRRTMGRVLVLLVSMGYGGWVRAHLSANRRVMLISFACVYMSASCLAEVVKLLSLRLHLVKSFFVVALELPVSILDASCVIWVWMELKTLITQLRQRRQILKLRMYRTFKWLLLLYIIIGAFWSMYEMWIFVFEPSMMQQQAFAEAKSSDAIARVKDIDFTRLVRDKRWATNWSLVAFWNILYMFILVCLMILWRPQNNDQRFVIVPGLKVGSEEWMPADASASDIEKASLIPRTETDEMSTASDGGERASAKQQKKQKKTKKQKFVLDEDLEQELEDFGDENDSDVEQKED